MRTGLLLEALAALLLMESAGSAQAVYSGPEGVVFDTLYDRYLIANWNNRTIVQVGADGQPEIFVSGGPRIGGMKIVGDLLYAAGETAIVAYSLSDAALAVNVPVAGANLLNAMVTDTSGYLYVSDGTPNRVYRLRLSDNSYTVFVDNDPLLPFPIGLFFEEETNRLLVTVRPEMKGIIRAVNLPGNTVSEVVTTNQPPFAYLTQDNQGRYLTSCFSVGIILRFDHNFSETPALVLAGYTTPTQLFYNKLVDTLVIPDYGASEVHWVSFRDDDQDLVEAFHDNCESTYNPDQADSDYDLVGDACDACTDTDYDGYGDPGFPASTCQTDNCPAVPNPEQLDADQDGVGDICDNCPDTPNPLQEDENLNLIGDVCEGCCEGRVGDANGQGGDEPTIGDVSTIIDALFITGLPDPIICLAEADINLSGGADPVFEDITVGDISALVDYLFITGPSLGLGECP